MQMFIFMLIFSFAGFLIFMSTVYVSGYRRKGCACRINSKTNLKKLRIHTKL